jgi:sugar phosphate isomerase/epimerase
MAEPFKLCILFGDNADRDPARIAPGYDMAEIPVALQVKPFDSDALWEQKKAEIASWSLPPIKASSHFLQFWGLKPVGPGADWEQLDFWTMRAFRRLAELGVETVGIYGGFFSVPDGFSRTKAMDQGIRFANMVADHADALDMMIALEPLSDLTTLWPRYLEGIEFARRVGRKSVRVMADIDYLIALDSPLEDIAKEPDYCMHVHIAGDGGQPGVGDNEETLLHLFRVLRDCGYERGVSSACPWVDTEGKGSLDFRGETANSLAYLQSLRERVYSE